MTPDRRGTGASRYATSRLEVARRGTESPEIAALQMNAFDAGYTNALGEHQLPSESEVSGESARVCVATHKDAMITDFEAACTSVVLEVCASYRKAVQQVGPPPPP